MFRVAFLDDALLLLPPLILLHSKAQASACERITSKGMIVSELDSSLRSTPIQSRTWQLSHRRLSKRRSSRGAAQNDLAPLKHAH
jgi:hypothetical protein